MYLGVNFMTSYDPNHMKDQAKSMSLLKLIIWTPISPRKQKMTSFYTKVVTLPTSSPTLHEVTYFLQDNWMPKRGRLNRTKQNEIPALELQNAN